MKCSVCGREFLNSGNFIVKRGICKNCDCKERYRVRRMDKDYKEKKRLYAASYRQKHKNNPDFLARKHLSQQRYQQANKEKMNANAKRYRDRHIEDSLFRFKKNIRVNVSRSFSRHKNYMWSKTTHTEEILGCSIDFFIEYIQSQFVEGMSLENYGEWELDHIIPLDSTSSEKEVYRLCHYTNYQPLWKSDNRSKGNKIGGKK